MFMQRFMIIYRKPLGYCPLLWVLSFFCFIKELLLMDERLSWKEIQNKFPDQWVGLTEVEYEPDNSATIKSGIVTYVNLPKSELTDMMLNGKCISRYTTPDNIFQLGIAGVL
jgi:hypothetical protein